MDKLYAITKKGRRISGDVAQKDSDGLQVLRHLHSNGSSSPNDLAAATGLGRNVVGSTLRQLKERGMVTQVA